MGCLNPGDVQSRHIMSEDGQAECLYSGVGNRGGNSTSWCIGNGQLQQLKLHKLCPTLNCMHDQIAVLVRKRNDTVERSGEMESEYEVRRLTPTECAALQGFPVDWCADVEHSDSAEYKLWGNGIALPSILPFIQNAVRHVENMRKDGTIR